MIIERYRGEILRGRKRWGPGVGLTGENTRSIDVALRPARAVLVIGANGRRATSGKSEKQHQRNEDRWNTENEDEPVHGNQDADCCGESSGLQDCEWAAPPTSVMNSRRLMGYPSRAKDHDLIITPRVVARSGQLCPLWVISGRDAAYRYVCFVPERGH